MSVLRVVALAHDPAGPSARYRLAQFAAPLAAAGVSLSVLPLPRSTGHRIAAFAALPPHDLVVLSRVLLGSGEVKRLRRAARRIVFDVDDALPFRPAHDGGGRSSRRSARFKRLCGAADLVVAGNAYLAELAAPLARAVAVVPTAVDLARYPAAPAAATAPVMVWIGQPVTAPYLHGLGPALAVVAARRPEAVLHAIGAEPPKVAGLVAEHRPWSEETEVADLRRGQVALAPLPDDPWTRGKCALRLLQYLAAGVPAVASPVGVQGEMLAAAPIARAAGPVAAWPEAILDLLADPAGRARLAAEGRAFVEARFSVTAVLPALLAAWRRAA